MLKSLIFRAESDFDFRPDGVGIDFDKIERHVKARSSKLLKTSDSVATPELEVIFFCSGCTTNSLLNAHNNSHAKTFIGLNSAIASVDAYG